MANEQLIMQLSMIQEEAKKLEEQLNIVNQQLDEFEILKISLDEIVKKDKDESIITSIGKGIFINTTLKEKEFFVNIGGNIVIKKDSKETKEIIEKQQREMAKIKGEIEYRMIELNQSLTKLIEEAQSQEHVHDENCNHEDYGEEEVR